MWIVVKSWLIHEAWKYFLALGVLVGVTELAARSKTRLAALVISLPLMSIVAYILVWQRDQDLLKLTSLARDTLILVPLGLPFFVPLAFAGKWGLGFWGAFWLGVVLAAVCISLWMWLGQKV